MSSFECYVLENGLSRNELQGRLAYALCEGLTKDNRESRQWRELFPPQTVKKIEFDSKSPD
jgi:hypothetical protein